MPNFNPNEKVQPVNVAEEMSKSFLDYSMSVIISRALPDARDGLKPSQRRILVTMNDLGVLPNRKHIKCAKIVGDTVVCTHPEVQNPVAVRYAFTMNPVGANLYNRDGLRTGQGAFELWPRLGLENDAAHAFYMGVELAHAVVREEAQLQALDP